MDKPFRLWHKGAILNLQGCKIFQKFKYLNTKYLNTKYINIYNNDNM